jgi:hypothetical protein
MQRIETPRAEVKRRRRGRWILVLAGLAAVVLTIIGVRFIIMPEAAARMFGVPSRPPGFQWHAVVGLRDLWLGLMALGLVWLAEWRALTLWLGLGALVCFGDAGVVVGVGGKFGPFAFHVFSGFFCAGLAIAAWRRSRQMPGGWAPTDALDRR